MARDLTAGQIGVLEDSEYQFEYLITIVSNATTHRYTTFSQDVTIGANTWYPSVSNISGMSEVFGESANLNSTPFQITFETDNTSQVVGGVAIRKIDELAKSVHRHSTTILVELIAVDLSTHSADTTNRITLFDGVLDKANTTTDESTQKLVLNFTNPLGLAFDKVIGRSLNRLSSLTGSNVDSSYWTGASS